MTKTTHALPDRPAWANELLSEASWTLMLSLFVAELDARGRTILAVESDGIVLRDERGDNQSARLGLHSIAHRVSTMAPSRWHAEIRRFLDLLERIDPESELASLSRERLRLRVIDPRNLVSPGFLLREFAPGLGVALVADAGETLSYLDAEQAGQRLQIDRAALEAAGVAGLLANTEPHLEAVDGAPFPLLQVVMKESETASYAASALLCLRELGIDPTHGALVVAPAAGACFVSPLDAEAPWERLGPLAAFSAAVGAESQHPLPPLLYWWHDGLYEPIEVRRGERDGQVALAIHPPDALLERYGTPLPSTDAPGDHGLVN